MLRFDDGHVHGHLSGSLLYFASNDSGKGQVIQTTWTLDFVNFKKIYNITKVNKYFVGFYISIDCTIHKRNKIKCPTNKNDLTIQHDSKFSTCIPAFKDLTCHWKIQFKISCR